MEQKNQNNQNNQIEQWEYKTLRYRHSFRFDDDIELNKLGERGWEAYAIRRMDNPDCYVTEIFLKRKKGGIL